MWLHPSLYKAVKLTFHRDVDRIVLDGRIMSDMCMSLGHSVGVLSPADFQRVSTSCALKNEYQADMLGAKGLTDRCKAACLIHKLLCECGCNPRASLVILLSIQHTGTNLLKNVYLLVNPTRW